MNSWSDAPRLRSFFANVARRVALIGFLQGATAGAALAIVIAVIGWMSRWNSIVAGIAGVSAILLAAGIRLILLNAGRENQLTFAAKTVERKSRGLRNLLVTAAEIIQHPAAVRPQIGAKICSDAEKAVAGLDIGVVLPSRRNAAVFSGTIALWLLALLVVAWRPAPSGGSVAASGDVATISDIELTVVPPSYTGRREERFQNASRLEIFSGSTVRTRVRSNASILIIETVDGRDSLRRGSNGEFNTNLVVDSDGFIAFDPVANDGTSGARRLIGVSTTPDNQPRARIVAPGRDLFLSDGKRNLDLSIEASDDIGLAALKLVYTRVSGSGEQFTFTDGEVQLEIAKADTRSWTARANWPLGDLGMQAGDLVVYRALTTDNRPGAKPAESDAFIIEITGPGALTAGGFSVDDERDRYAVSQQMVILKSERLLARRDSMTADAFREESMNIAAEQRKVRAEFVFMLGGELAAEVEVEAAGMGDLDEHAHAATDEEAIAGRLANQGRVDILRAIRSMSQAAGLLVDIRLDSALVSERAALVYLQRAFSRTRYILRTLTEREALDLSRRLSGVLSTAVRDARPIPENSVDSLILEARQSLGELAAIAGANEIGADAAQRISAIAARLARASPGRDDLHDVAMSLGDAASAISGRRIAEARSAIERALLSLASIVRAALPASPNPQSSIERGLLEGTLIDAFRRGAGGGSR